MKVHSIRAKHILSHLGAQKADILRETGLKEPLPKMISYLEEAQLLRVACDLLGDQTFAAKAGITLVELGSVTSYISKHSKTLRRAIESTSRFHELYDPALQYSLRVSGNSASVEFEWKDASFARFQRHTEFLMFGVLSRMRALTKTGFYPLELRFDHQVGRSAGLYQKIGGFSVVFGAERPELILSLSSLDLPIPTYDPILRDHLTAYSERLLVSMPKAEQTLRARTEAHIVAGLPGYVPHAEDLASALGMSVRTFARRLKEEGASYRTIVDELRYDLSKSLIKNGLNLSEVAFTLGYSDQAAFSTAFKRWSGHTPSDFAA